MKKKPARQPRKIEVVEDSPVATNATKRIGKRAPTDATPIVVETPTPNPEQNATVAKSGAKKGKTKAEAKTVEPTSRFQNASLNNRPLSRGWKAS